ncbi:TetR family transcriptional regulator [Streptomyces sp. NPDC058417]|uniref:TetR/AcrR family transcriptional regulator n=2 Tax=Streptomyces TaxID=1883 RepID=UPI003646B7F7
MNKPRDGGPGPRRGRRGGDADTRAQILAVARRRFPAEGYDAVTLRSLAAEAGVDVALISYFFGSKKGLFGAALALEANPAEELSRMLEGDLLTLPQRVLGRVLELWEDDRVVKPLRAVMLRSASDPGGSALLKQMMERELVEPLARRLGGGRAHQRAGAFVAHLFGLIWTRYLLEVEPLASMSPDEILRRHVPVLRAALADRPGVPAGPGGPFSPGAPPVR